MKFHELPAGGWFELDGQRLVKTGPLTASDGNGTRRMVARSAAVVPLADDGGRTIAVPAARDLPQILAAHALYRDQVVRRIRALGDLLGEEALAAIEGDLLALESAFLAAASGTTPSDTGDEP